MQQTNPKTIKFYRERDAYGCFSNFSPHAIILEDKQWKTTEHYFQAKKFAGTEWEEEIRLALDPSSAKFMGGSRAFPLRSDWEEVKDEIMYDCVYAKFTQNEDIKKVLLGTGDATLVEHTTNDRYWGDGGDGSGKNMLGKTLMKVRQAIREAENK